MPFKRHFLGYHLLYAPFSYLKTLFDQLELQLLFLHHFLLLNHYLYFGVVCFKLNYDVFDTQIFNDNTWIDWLAGPWVLWTLIIKVL
jgi:hypothetical protein